MSKFLDFSALASVIHEKPPLEKTPDGGVSESFFTDADTSQSLLFQYTRSGLGSVTEVEERFENPQYQNP